MIIDINSFVLRKENGRWAGDRRGRRIMRFPEMVT
jgi:hypothetical protein